MDFVFHQKFIKSNILYTLIRFFKLKYNYFFIKDASFCKGGRNPRQKIISMDEIPLKLLQW